MRRSGLGLPADWGGTALARGGVVRARQFPIVVVTSNGEQDFPVVSGQVGGLRPGG
ncbi:hypothetical protein [Frankia nepalensis]|uniref:Uncharacterized protein n=1 Tax=Frankia nepalensis TaxID=1836974 RepID=A0A937RB17_9ACTN|nr:hypothetical protein [Frankia nepalensis]MBL7500863.1 hypothetical protein [Frankia nepalensis]MBL7509229.1 hypothetical protein [Frankia nepalensis]MBL7627007.1 hypothetical protein [Frankia nepalensis]